MAEDLMTINLVIPRAVLLAADPESLKKLLGQEAYEAAMKELSNG